MTLAYIEGAPTIGATEYSLPNASTTLTPRTDIGVVQVFLDLNAISNEDRFELAIKEKARAADTQQRVLPLEEIGKSTDKLFTSPKLMLARGWDITLKKLAGTDRAIPYSIRRWPAASMTFLENSATITTTEHSLPANATYSPASPQTTAGEVQAFVDVSALQAADDYRLRIYEKARAADTQRLLYDVPLEGVQSLTLWPSPVLTLSRGWDITLAKVAGTDRAISWSVRRLPDA